MNSCWWIISVSIHTTGWDGSPDGENYPVVKNEVFKICTSENQDTFDFFL